MLNPLLGNPQVLRQSTIKPAAARPGEQAGRGGAAHAAASEEDLVDWQVELSRVEEEWLQLEASMPPVARPEEVLR